MTRTDPQPTPQSRLAVGALIAALMLPAGSSATATSTVPAAGSAAAAAPGAATLLTTASTGKAGVAGAVTAHLELTAAAPTVDVMVLLDNSVSMLLRQQDILQQLSAGLQGLSAQGMNVQAGLSLAGSTFSLQAKQTMQTDDSSTYTYADPLVDPETPGYTGPPKLFSRVAPIGPLTSFNNVAANPTPENLSLRHHQRGQAQLLAIDEVLTGSAFAGTPNDLHRDMIPAGQAAGWRSTPGAVRVLVDATDQTFDIIQGAPAAADGTPDVAGEGAKLAAQGVRHVGLVTFGYDLAVRQLGQLSDATGTYVPTGGLPCGGLHGDQIVPAGAPLVCTDTQAGMALQAAVDGYPHTGPMVITAGTEASTGGKNVFTGLTGQTTTQADAWKGGTATVTVAYTCPTAGTETRHDLPLAATYDGTQIATGTATVTCLATGATAPDAVPPPAPAVIPVNQPPAPAPPAPTRPAGPAPLVSAPASSPPPPNKRDGAAPTAVALGQAPPPPAVVPAPAVAPAVAPAPAPAAAPVPAPIPAAAAAPGAAPAQAAAGAAAPAGGQVAAVAAPQPGLAFGVAEQEQQLALARQQAQATPTDHSSDHNGDPTAYVTWLACLVLLFGGVTALHLQRQHATTRPATVTSTSTDDGAHRG